MRALFSVIALLALNACASSPINRLSAQTRADVALLSSAYGSFAKTSAAAAMRRVQIEADYQAQNANLARYEEYDILLEKLSQHPNLRLQADLEGARDKLKSDFLRPPDSAAAVAAFAAGQRKIEAPTAALAEVQAGLKQLEREKSGLEAFFDFARFVSETVELVEAGLEESRIYREQVLKGANAAPSAN
jgi:hypothetical protein